MKTLNGGLLAAAMALCVAGSHAQAQEKQFLNIGTAGISGLYYPTGGFICNAVNKSREANGHNIRCSVESTAGSIANIRTMKAGDLDVALSQSDWQYHAINGTSKFEEEGTYDGLRFLFSLHGEAFHIVTTNPDVNGFMDLEGLAVNTGNAGSGTEATVYFAMDHLGLDPSSFFSRDSKLTSREQAQALCDGNIDAFLFPIGPGSSTVQEAVNTCDARVVGWWSEEMAELVAETSYLGEYVILAETYPGMTEDQKTWGPAATIIGSADADEDVIYQVVKAVFDNFNDFKKLHIAYAGLTPEGSVANGQSAPYHPGAERYFREVGLME